MVGFRRVVVVGALLVAGCKEPETDGISEARARMRPLVDAACEWMYGCCGDDELVYQVGDFTVDVDDCTERMLDAIESGAPLDLEQPGLSDTQGQALLLLALAINRGRVSTIGAGIQECADATADLACNAPAVVDPDGRCTPEDAPVDPPCDPEDMFRGEQGLGEECDANFECADGLRCVLVGVAGACGRGADEGETCYSDAECIDPLVCDWGTGTCTAGAAEGFPCAFADPANPVPGTETTRCAKGLACDPFETTCVGGFCTPGAACFDVVNDSDCPAGTWCVAEPGGLATCRPAAGVGASCTKPDNCLSNFCDPATMTCGNALGLGEPCFDHTQCESGFCTGLCSPTAGNGELCPTGQNQECRDGYCDFMTGTCLGYTGPGGPCMTGLECDPALDLVCAADMTCKQPPFPVGTPCVSPVECETQVCFMGECTPATPIGQACNLDGTVPGCVVGSFCNTPDPATTLGTCTELLRPGQACLRSEECWGECIVRYGQLMCDATPAFDLDELWCDGG